MNYSKNKQRRWYHRGWIRVIGVILLIVVLGFSLFLFLVIHNIKAGRLSGVFSTAPAQLNEYDLSYQNKSVISLVENTSNPSIGPEDSPITVVEFADFRCPVCQSMHPIIRRLTVEYKDRVHFIFRDYPLIGEDSAQLAHGGRCAHEQGKFFPYHDFVYANSSNITLENLPDVVQRLGIDQASFLDCQESGRYNDAIEADIQAGFTAGVTGTPTFFVNGNKIPGGMPYLLFKEVLDTSLSQAYKLH